MTDPTSTARPAAHASLRLAVLDLDGTLNTIHSPYSFVHQALGVEEQADRVYARYRRGEITYLQWGQEEVRLWRDVPVEQLQSILRGIPYRPGAVSFLHRLRAAGVTVALVSAGFDLHVMHHAAELGADVAFYNRLGLTNGRLTGEFFGGVDAQNKGRLVRQLQDQFSVSRAETLAAGDTPADIPMFGEAAVSIAVDPVEPEVAQQADMVLPDADWSNAEAMIQELRPGWLPDVTRPR